MKPTAPAGWRRSLLAFLVTALITVGLLETVLRLTVDRSTLYKGLTLHPDLNRKKFERAFSQRYGGKELIMDTYDPQLGWDFDIGGNRIRGERTYPPSKAPGRYRIVAVGDSFTYGTDVEAGEAFPAVLETMLCNSDVINMGVPGYGIDQAALKYALYGKEYAPDALILGVFPDDYERASVPFHAFAKPWYQPKADGGYRLANQPVPAPRAELERIRDEEAQELYAWVLLQNLWRQGQTVLRGKQPALARIDGAVAHILSTLKSELQKNGAHLFIVQIPGGDTFRRRQSRWEHDVSQRLKALYRKLDIPYLDLDSAFRARHSAQHIVETFYVVLDNGSIGHLSAAGNAEAAQLIADALQSLDNRVPVGDCNGATPTAQPPGAADRKRL